LKNRNRLLKINDFQLSLIARNKHACDNEVKITEIQWRTDKEI